MKKEKRRFTRIPFKVKAEMMVNNVLYNTDKINNLSVGGCLLSIKADLKSGTVCLVKIVLSGTSSEVSIKVNGTIVRCDQKAVAVKFTHIDTDSLFHLQNIIRYNSPDPETIDREIYNHPSLR